ncbi:MAG: MgtC/SapB family protein [Provencibacterium sp.]|nr:MgtC/SapB family protein [Provencibacterium sp.]
MEPFTSSAYWLTQLEYVVRLVAAAVCGAAVGYERKNRLKEAGIRTHLIVSLASALMMVISKYGFYDVLVHESIKLDPARIAAGIVSGIGFLGTGMILIRNKSISGLTTAAGIWATMGVGMAMGGGMYILGLSATALIICAQILLHRNLHWLQMPLVEAVSVRLYDNAEAVAFLQQRLAEHKIQVVNLKADKTEAGIIEVTLIVKLPSGYEILQLVNLFEESPYIQSVEL